MESAASEDSEQRAANRGLKYPEGVSLVVPESCHSHRLLVRHHIVSKRQLSRRCTSSPTWVTTKPPLRAAPAARHRSPPLDCCLHIPTGFCTTRKSGAKQCCSEPSALRRFAVDWVESPQYFNNHLTFHTKSSV